MATLPPKLDLPLAHRYFAVQCFNDTWTYIEKPTRTGDEDEAMILCSHASLWHWTQRADCTDRHRSIGHWQISRVYALAGQAENALRHGRRSLEFSAGSAPFFVGYAHESIARAAAVMKNESLFCEHLALASKCAQEVIEANDRALLEKDLQALERQ